MSTSTGKTLPQYVATMRDADVSPLGRKRIVDAFTDVTACAFAGALEPLAAPLLDVFNAGAKASDLTPSGLLGRPLYASPQDAALFNGAFAHALDYDDISHPAYSHPSVALVPALYAACAYRPVTGKALVTAYATGLQVFGRLGRALNLTHAESGWHPTSTFGSIAAAAAVANLLGLSEKQVEAAVAIGASSACGLRANFGTMTKPVHAGFAARNALLAARLAQQGLSAAPDVLTRHYGFGEVFNARSDINWSALQDWDGPQEIDSPYGLNLKPFPSCAGSHTAIEAALTLRDRLVDRLDQIERITVGAGRVIFSAMLYAVPETGLQAKFSMPYCVAAALVDGKIDLGSFTAERIRGQAVGALMPRIEMVDDERVRDHSELGTIVTVTLRDGTVLQETVLIAAGKPERWFTRDQLHHKFRDCTENTGTPAWRESAFEALQGMDTDAPASRLLETLDLARAN